MHSETNPLTFPQQAIFIDGLLHGATTKYTMGGGIVIRGPLDGALFRRAAEFAFRHHDAQRIRIHVDGHAAHQEFAEDAEPQFEALDYSGRSEPFRAAIDWILADIDRPESGFPFPPSADTLLRLGDDLHLWYSKFHHIANDGYGHSVITATVAAAYNSLHSCGRLPELERRSYAEFIRDDREYAASAHFRRDEAFWRGRFPSMPEPLPFTSRKRTLKGDALQTNRCVLAVHRLVHNAILRCCDEAGVTPAQFLLAVLVAYLNRVTGRDDIVVGMPVLNRSNHAFRQTAGMFMNMMPLRVGIPKDATVFGLARSIAAEVRSCFRHQRFPLGEILRHCRSVDGFCQSVYDVTFVYRKLNYDVRFGDSHPRPITLDPQARDETLSLEIDDYNAEEDVNFLFNYNPQLISPEEAGHMARAFEALLVDVAVAGDRPVRELRLLAGSPAASRVRRSEPVEATVLDVLADRVAETPDKVAVADDDTSLTYCGLNEASGRVAAFLVQEGIEKEQPVAVLCDRNVSWIAVLLGIMKAGGVYLPLDPDAPQERLEFILGDSGCRLLLAGPAQRNRQFAGVRTAPIEEVLRFPAVDTVRRAGVRSLAYIIYTSGTTGRPKGVLLEHAGLTNTATALAGQWKMKPADALLQFSSPMFDASMAEIFVPLVAGSRMVIAPRAVTLDPGGFRALLDRQQVTVAILPPSYVSALGRAELPTLRILATGGEEANPADVAHYSRSCTCVNVYGPTETTIIVTTYTAGPGSGFAQERVPIGVPIANTGIYILDENLQLLPPGAAGEICIGGVNVARGYLNRPELTRERFVANPFREGERLYRSGDIGRLLADGNIEYLGRRDTQVKIRGYRVELGEIETLLKTHPAVENAAVAGAEGDLAGYVVPRGEFRPDELRRFLAAKLPAYMIPSRWLSLPAFPVNSSGKVDYPRLPAIPAETPHNGDQAPPLTEMEKAVAGIWQEVLGCGSVPRMADFFELGGHSLKAVAVLSKIGRVLGARVAMKEFFSGPTVAQLAAAIEKCAESPEECPVSQAPLTESLSSLQERIWLVCQLDPANTAYVMPCHLRVRGRFDAAVFEDALQFLWRRHDSLRSVFPSRDGRPVRTLLPPDTPVVHSYAVASWEEHYSSHHAAAFELDKGPLFHASIYRIAEEEHVVLVDIHHINADGFSLVVLREELFEIYRALLDGRRPALPAPGAGYGDFIEHEAAVRESAAYRSAFERRVQELAGAPALIDFRFDRALPDGPSHPGSAVLHRYEELSLLNRAFERARADGLSPFMAVLAAYGTMLHLHTGQEELLVGIPTSVRSSERFARTIGFFVNTCVVRLDFRGSPTLGEIMKRTRNAVAEMLQLPEAAFDSLVRRLDAKRTPNRAPLVQAALSFLMEEAPGGAPAGDLAVEPVYLARDSAMFELSMDVILQGEQGICGLEYQADAWEETSARRMLDHFHAILRAMADRPDLRPRAIDLAPPVLAGEPLDTAVRSVPDWIREHAHRKPEATALIAGGVRTTYSELQSLVEARREQLATLGLEPGAVLALACASGLEWTATAMAAMAEGLAVLPLDANAPAARVRYTLENAGAALVWHEDSLPIAEADPPCRSGTGPAVAALGSTAYIVYTSGTTGSPKGVRVSHGAFETHCRSAIRAYGLREDDTALVFAPSHFDASWEQLFAPLVAGASVLIRDAQLWAPEEWCRRIEEERVTCADIPPQFLREVLFYLEKRPDRAPRSLRMVISGGEAMPSPVAEAWLAGPLGHLPLINVYGPTEAVVTSTFHRIERGSRIAPAGGVVPIGVAMPGRVLHILDADGLEVGAGICGELCIGGDALADGYHGDEARTGEAFRYWLPGGWSTEATPGAVRLYRSGDRVRLGPDGCIEFLGRVDRQIKIRGFRVEPGEIEAVLARHPSIAQALVVSRDEQLVAYCVPAAEERPSRGGLAQWLSAWLPEYMIPSATVFVQAFPTTASGKIDVSGLDQPVAHAPGSETSSEHERPVDELTARISAIWADLLGRPAVGLDDNFFDLGGHSLLLVRLHTRLTAELGASIRLVDLFANPTVARMAMLLSGESDERRPAQPRPAQSRDVAVIGLAGRFPGAANVDELWNNLVAGKECIRFFTGEELAAEGVPAGLRAQPEYVPAHGYLEGSKQFDAGFFGYTPKEAELIDPQQRLFLEESWHALENAGCDPGRYAGDIAVFAGTGMNMYLLDNLAPRMRQEHDAEAYAISLANDKDFVTSRVSYKLNLRGPSVNVNTACSTSLVAIHTAAEALLAGSCDMALAGGVTLSPSAAGYLYQLGGIASPDGHCRAFAEEAAGTVGGSGVAVVVLKRLDQAIADGDTIRAVIKGSAVNNDGADKIGFTAPGVNRQRDVIRAALDRAGVTADSVGYVEAHGTGTPMGDPIEVEALSAAFAPDGPAPQSCLLGSIKSNVGHLDTAAGAAGFIKAVLAVEKALIPASLHCQRPSTKIGFERTPFRVVQELTPWPGDGPRRAGVSSFGMGGTNAHVVLGEAPAASTTAGDPPVWCIPVSARSEKSLLGYAANLARHIEEHPAVSAADVWFTLSEGRRRFGVRAVVLAASRGEAIAALRALSPGEDFLSRFAGREEFRGAVAFAKAWLSGEQSEAAALLPPGPSRRIPLPGYVFDQETYWAEPLRADVPSKLPLKEWFYFPAWERLPLRPARSAPAEPILIIHNGSAAETRWLEALGEAGVAYTAELSKDLANRARVPEHCWQIAALGFAPGNAAAYAQRLDALLADIRALAAARNGEPIRLLLLAPHKEALDAAPAPAFAYLDAACTGIAHEYASISASVVHLDPESPDINAVLSAAGLSDAGRTLALQGGRLWRRTYSRLPAGNVEHGAARLKENGVYLLTGGLGGVGLALADELARRVHARLVLVSRRAPDAAQREAIRAIEAAGAQVRTVALDLADGPALRALVDDICAQWGRIDGVIHAAGVAGGSLIARTRLEEIERVLRAKVAGTESLAAALAGREPSFVLLCSSLTASLGGPGQAAYAAANAWQDAFAVQQSLRGSAAWISVEWDTWAEAGMAAHTGALLKEWRITPDSYWPWGEHRIEGAATLPGTAYLELFAQALGEPAVEIGPVVLLEPMIGRGEEPLTVEARRDGEEVILRSSDGTRTREHARAHLRGAPAATTPEPLPAIEARCTIPLDLAGSVATEGIAIEAGPRWRVRGECWKGRDEALARLELPERFAADLTDHPLHPALLDIAISFYIAVEGGAELLPWRYETVRVYAPLTRAVFSHVRLRSRSERSLVLDAQVRDESGRVLVEVEGYTLVRALGSRRDAPAISANPFAMTRKEGVEVFLRALDMAEPVVCISTVEWKHAAAIVPLLPASTEAPAEPTAQAGETATDLQALMAGVWAEVLGYAHVGIEDDLFDLGADSLTALQASARWKQLTGRELSMDRFFDNATVANLVAGEPAPSGSQPAPVAAGNWEEGEL